MASWVTSMPGSHKSSGPSRSLSGKREESQPPWLMISPGKRWCVSRAGSAGGIMSAASSEVGLVCEGASPRSLCHGLGRRVNNLTMPREKCLAKQKTHYLTHKEEHRRRQCAYDEAHQEELHAHRRAYYQAHREECRL